MAKRKKIKSKSLSPKLQEAQHRKVYIRKLINFAEATGVEDFELLASGDTLRRMFDMRVGNAPLITSSADISTPMLKQIREKQELFLNEFKLTFTEGGPEVTLRDFLSVGQTLYFFLTTNHTPAPPEILKQRFADYIKLLEDDGRPFHKLNEAVWFAVLDESTLDTKMYWVEHQYKLKNMRLINHFELHAIRPEQKKIKINDILRTVLRVGWTKPNDGPEWATVEGAFFGVEQTLPVYIQSHALHRMNERLDCISAGLQHFYLFICLRELVVVENQTGQKLIEYRYQDQKLGYLLAEVIDGILLIRTFLFITMDRTPEGQALQEAIGLEAVDKKYLAIDRLSTFILSDIPNHPDIKEYFMEAGCADLFNFDTSALQSEHQFELGQFIRSYLDINRSKTPVITMTEEEPIQEAVA